MSTTIFWLVAAILFTAAMWFPYVLNRIVINGLMPSLGYGIKPPADNSWASRSKKAHINAVENLVLFAPLVLIHELITPAQSDPAVACAAIVYFVARVAHYVVYTAGIPVLRTLTFAAGYGATIFVALRVLGCA